MQQKIGIFEPKQKAWTPPLSHQIGHIVEDDSCPP